jgi:Cdc6-like AAA superfamily ATPase
VITAVSNTFVHRRTCIKGSFAEECEYILDLLRSCSQHQPNHQPQQAEQLVNTRKRLVVIVLDEFHRFVEHSQQAFLYFLLDSLSLLPPINAVIVGCSPVLVCVVVGGW